MKTFFMVAGVFFLIIGSLNMIKYLSDYDVLAPYGKGFIWGNALLVGIGLVSLLWGLRKKG